MLVVQLSPESYEGALRTLADEWPHGARGRQLVALGVDFSPRAALAWVLRWNDWYEEIAD